MTEWKLVPVEPTEAMWKAADKQSEFCAIHNYGASPSAEDYWHAMLDAAPTLENGPAGLADATNDPADPDLSSLRKGAEDIEVTDEMIEAGKEAANGWTDRYMDGAEFVNWDEALPEIFRRMLDLVSGSREDGA